MSIDVAYCIQLGRIVYIDEARLEYSAQSVKRDFDFLCADPNCRQPDLSRTQIAAINYKVPPLEETKQRPNFRTYPKQRHFNCSLENAAKQLDAPKQEEESELDFKRRRSLAAIRDRIDVFVRPTSDEDSEKVINETPGQQPRVGQSKEKDQIGKEVQPLRCTTLLDSLVSFYLANRDARNEGLISKDDFFNIEFSVKGEGDYRLFEFFRRVERVYQNNGSDEDKFHGVYIANCYKVEKYGLGFKLYLANKLDGKLASIYMGHEKIAGYRYKNNFFDIIHAAGLKHYLKVYFINPVFMKQDKNVEIILESPKFLSLRVGNIKNQL